MRRLRRNGWKVMSHVAPKTRDIDHIAIGPTGVLIVETKWMSRPLNDREHERLRQDCRTLRSNVRTIMLGLKGVLPGAPVKALLVYWQPSWHFRTRDPQ